MTRFDTIDYLERGNAVQQKAFSSITKNRIFELLADFSPVLTGTIPIEIDIEGSDLDIICCYDAKEEFENTVIAAFSLLNGFSIRTVIIRNEESVIANFYLVNLKSKFLVSRNL